jgi:coenzyme F420-reducing hydrogenase alpha subunit
VSRIHLKKATRIEGSADIHIEAGDAGVTAARFMVQDFRGFERFVRGRDVHSAPQLVSRVCGLCSVSHQVAALRAMEAALDVPVTKSTRSLRGIALLGEWVASHAVSSFFLSSAADGDVFDRARSGDEDTELALELRVIGQRVVQTVCGRAVHPVSLRIGGMASRPDEDSIVGIQDLCDRGIEIVTALSASSVREHRVDAFEILPAHPVNLVCVEQIDGEPYFAVRDREAQVRNTFQPAEFGEHVREMRADWSLAKFPYLKDLGFPDGIMLVGPLARGLGGRGAAADERVTAVLQAPDDSKLSLELFAEYRLLELLWSLHKIRDLVDHVDPDDVLAPDTIGGSGVGVGVVEAPRGILVHRYDIEEGVVSGMRMLVATQFNNAFINLVLKDLAQEHVLDGALSEEGSELIGRCIRLMDPCLSCATH